MARNLHSMLSMDNAPRMDVFGEPIRNNDADVAKYNDHLRGLIGSTPSPRYAPFATLRAEVRGARVWILLGNAVLGQALTLPAAMVAARATARRFGNDLPRF